MKDRMHRSHKGDGFRTGPKFGEYLEMNLRMVRAQYVGAAAGAFLLVTGQWLLMMIGLFAVCSCILSVYSRLFSETLYQKQACLFQSFPVSAFETALVKTLAGSIAPLLVVLVYIGFGLLGIDAGGDGGELLYTELLGSGFTRENMVAGAVLGFLGSVSFPFGICGIVLFAVAVGNRARENRDKSPKKWAIFLVIGLLAAAQAGITWVIDWIPVLSAMMKMILTLCCNLVLAAGMLVVNTRVLERWYSA